MSKHGARHAVKRGQQHDEAHEVIHSNHRTGAQVERRRPYAARRQIEHAE
ncbi:MAG: hypothetical protein ACPHO6_14070 [Candidatus Latescibacterota bacterium]